MKKEVDWKALDVVPNRIKSVLVPVCPDDGVSAPIHLRVEEDDAE